MRLAKSIRSDDAGSNPLKESKKRLNLKNDVWKVSEKDAVRSDG